MSYTQRSSSKSPGRRRRPWIFSLGLGTAALVGGSARAAPPEYHATVLPQLDANRDPDVLTQTAARALNESQGVAGLLGEGRGFAWSPRTGGARFAEVFGDGTWWFEGINDGGDMVGLQCTADGGRCDPFVYLADGTRSTLSVPAVDASGHANDINDAGVVVGTADVMAGILPPRVATVWHNGERIDIDDLGGNFGEAVAVNEEGVVAVHANSARSPRPRAYRWTEAEGLEPLPSVSDDHGTQPLDINDAGVVVGVGYENPTTPRAAYWSEDGTLHLLTGLYEPAEVQDIRVQAVNASQVMVGTELAIVDGIEQPREARLWIDDEPYHLQDLVLDLPEALVLTRAVDINDQGEIVVEARLSDEGVPRGVSVLLTPTSSGESGTGGSETGDSDSSTTTGMDPGDETSSTGPETTSVSGGDSGSTGSGSTGSGSTSGVGSEPASGGDSGCGCRATDDEHRAPGLLGLILLGGVAFARRRRPG